MCRATAASGAIRPLGPPILDGACGSSAVAQTSRSRLPRCLHLCVPAVQPRLNRDHASIGAAGEGAKGDRHMTDESVIRELTRTAEAMGVIADDEDRFRATFDAFLAADRESFQRLLGEFKVADRCELVCDWLCSKYCILVCLELCGRPTDAELPDLREFGEVVTRITGDEELVERLANAVADRDAEGFRALVTELKIERFCRLLCHWACSVRCRLLCDVVCSPTARPVASFVDELAQGGAAIATLTADARAIADVTKAVLAGDCEVVRGAVGRLELFDRCEFICEWLCTWRCVRVCLLLCREFPIEEPLPWLSEALEFAKVTAR